MHFPIIQMKNKIMRYVRDVKDFWSYRAGRSLLALGCREESGVPVRCEMCVHCGVASARLLLYYLDLAQP